jgi:hypothetical protein
MIKEICTENKRMVIFVFLKQIPTRISIPRISFDFFFTILNVLMLYGKFPPKIIP